MTAAEALKRATDCEAYARKGLGRTQPAELKRIWLQDAKEWRRIAAKLAEKEQMK